MRMTASWFRSSRADRIQVCGVKIAPNGELPSDRIDIVPSLSHRATGGGLQTSPVHRSYSIKNALDRIFPIQVLWRILAVASRSVPSGTRPSACDRIPPVGNGSLSDLEFPSWVLVV
jgi:hypothetical protein